MPLQSTNFFRKAQTSSQTSATTMIDTKTGSAILKDGKGKMP